ncbi:hypothetical protein [Chryseobacterium sp. IHB B 17019]|uniref:hypothetical protein n=1 Tax=Chryseobacterium sp. IHB B 17019 TaxID=1721091 RepID=UPI000A73004C|nr:hypothetical protein [Chryseobacterium sp. IHB B 17019]
MAIARQETYTIDLEKTGHLFATINYIDPNAKEEKFGCLLCDDVIVTFEEPTLRDKIYAFINGQYYQTFFEDISNLPKGTFIIIFGFLLFLNISMLSIKERFLLN